jgi:hypothetical protein
MRPHTTIGNHSPDWARRHEAGLAALLKAAAFIKHLDEGIRSPSPRHQENLKAPAPPSIVQCGAHRRFANSAPTHIRVRHDILEKTLRCAAAHQVRCGHQKAGRDGPILNDANHQTPSRLRGKLIAVLHRPQFPSLRAKGRNPESHEARLKYFVAGAARNDEIKA